MALAILTHEDSAGDLHRFRFDLGRNRYYAYSIGPRDATVRNGIRILSDPSHRSALCGPLPEGDEGRGELEVPAGLFDRENNTIQLVSFRTRDRAGPAFSSLLTLAPGDLSGDGSLPEISFSHSVFPVNTSRFPAPAAGRERSRARCSGVRLRRARQPAALSEAQDFGLSAIGSALLAALPTLLPMLIPAVAGAGSALLQAGTQILANPSVHGSVNGVLNTVLQGSGAVPAAPAIPPAAAPLARPASLARRRSRTALSFSRSQPVSEAMIAPALIAAIPALMPLLQQVLTPQTVQGVLQSADPNRLIGTVTQAIGQLGALGAQIDQQQMQHLERLNPGVDDPALMNLLAQMSTNFHSAKVAFRPARNVRLHPADLVPLPLEGRTMPLLRLDGDWSFPLTLETSRPVPPGELRLVLKHAATLEVVARHRVKTPPLGEGRMSVMNTLRREQLQSVRAGEDYLACFYLLWEDKSGRKTGAHITQMFTAVDEFIFDAIEESGEIVPLGNIDEHRDFWHQAWTTNLTRDVSRAVLECTYYFVPQGEAVDNAYVATTLKSLEKGLHRRQVGLESGILLGLPRLNDLLPRISAHPSLDEKQLAALAAPAFLQRTQRAARTSVKLTGRPGQSVALWVFPEVKINPVLLQHAVDTNACGHLRRLEPVTVHFPLPVMAHFVGVRSR